MEKLNIADSMFMKYTPRSSEYRLDTAPCPRSDNLRLKAIINIAFRQSLDPPKSPLIRGTLRKFLVPPLLRGVRGDLSFDTNKRDSRLYLKLTLLGLLECPYKS